MHARPFSLFRAKIPLRIVDDAPPGYTSNEEVHGVNKGPFKYASSQESGGVPELEMLVRENPNLSVAVSSIRFVLTFVISWLYCSFLSYLLQLGMLLYHTLSHIG
jgi:hypothetical protein